MKVEDLKIGCFYRYPKGNNACLQVEYCGTCNDEEHPYMFINVEAGRIRCSKEFVESSITPWEQTAIEDKALIADPPMYQTPKDVAEHVVEEHKREMVNHPQHYQGLEVIDAMEIAYGTKATALFCALNRFKYLSRMGKKAPNNYAEDAEKAEWYRKKYLELQEKYRGLGRIDGLAIDELILK